jgi:DNA glycosylase AlkZ-like
MAERTLTPRELNRAVLARQLLVERSSLSLPRALERIAGIQAQYAPSMYIGLWSRLERFERDALRLTVAGYRVVRFTWGRLTARPHTVARMLERLLATARPQPA